MSRDQFLKPVALHWYWW